jgi:hypothetical protein
MKFRTSVLALASAAAMVMPLASHAAPAGHFIKGDGDTIYWLGIDNKRYVFTDEVTIQSWLSQDNTQGEILAPDILATYPIGGAMTVRPGVFMVRFTSAPTVYVVTHGAVLHAMSDDMAAAYGGTDWKLKVQSLDVALFTNYRVGQPLKYVSDYDPNLEASLAATPDVEIANKLAMGTLAKSPSPFTGTVTFTQVASSSPQTATALVTVTKTNAPIANLRIDIYNDSGAIIMSCLATDTCRFSVDLNTLKTDTIIHPYAIVSNERGETLDKATAPGIILTPPSSLPQP